jgi:hypothetical protein
MEDPTQPTAESSMERRFDIKARGIAIVAIAASAVWMLPAGSQLLDTTLGDVIDREVEDEIAEELTEAVERDVESGVTQQIESVVTGEVEEQVESEVVEAVQQQVESGVVSTIVTEIESSVVGDIGEGLLGTVEGELRDVGGQLGDAAERAAQIGTDAVNAATNGVQSTADGTRAEPFVADVDVFGRSIEGDVWLILVPTEHAARIPSWGFTIRERHELATLGRVLLRVAAPEDREIAQAALELALDAPGTEVDFNHVYRPGADETAAETAAAVPAIGRGAAPRPPAPALAVGIVDTAVTIEHEALRSADVVQRDFVPFAAERPTAHGTAVASVLVGDAANLRPQLSGGRVYAASVFFADADGNDASTAESIAVAGEWLAAEGVRVINMSLAGPPNRVLEAAVAALIERGVIVVAAVGNNGPAGRPLYPAAYPDVVGITAIDSAQRVYRYANRGPHVTFAALGVDVRVARGSSGYRELSGTSIAAPHAAAVIARAVAGRTGLTSIEVLAELKGGALDLGTKDFDHVFGFGLIAASAAVTASR